MNRSEHMRIGVESMDDVLAAEVTSSLRRDHDVVEIEEVSSDPADASPDMRIVAWSARSLGREEATRRLDGYDPARTLVVIDAELLSDRLGVADAGVDYLVSPFHPLELGRRAGRHDRGVAVPPPALWVDDVMVDEPARTVARAGHSIDLTRREFDLLAHLVRNHDLVQERDAILRAVWSSTSYTPNVIEVTICSLRRKLEAHGPRMIHTVRGVGYVCRSDRSVVALVGSGVSQRPAVPSRRR